MMAAAHGISKQQKSRQVMMRAGHKHEPWPSNFAVQTHPEIFARRLTQDVLFLSTSCDVQAWGKT